MRSFITGSHDYGEPRTTSDVDLVVLVDSGDFNLLAGASDGGGIPVKFGKLNLIICQNEKDFMLWFMAREACRNVGRETGQPVSRDKAVEIHKKIFAKFGTPNSCKGVSG